MRAALAACFMVAGVARADVATWFWTVSDTGNGDGVIEPGESAMLRLSMAFDPPQDPDGFSEAGPYGIFGDSAWSHGTIDTYDMKLDWYTPDPVIDEWNNIREITNFQFARLWGDAFDSSNPIELFVIRWTPGTYEKATVNLDNGGPDAWVYINPVGDRLLYAGEGGAVSFRVVPAPAASLVALGAMGWACSKRRRPTP